MFKNRTVTAEKRFKYCMMHNFSGMTRFKHSFLAGKLKKEEKESQIQLETANTLNQIATLLQMKFASTEK